MTVLLLAVGIYLSIKTHFVQVRKLGASIRQVVSGGRSSFRAVCTALAGTVGTGNVAGVAGAIALGGPGAVFWMWVSAFLGMATKYAEVVLAMRFRGRGADGSWQGGSMYSIRGGLGSRWKWLAAWFAFGGVLVSLGMGNIAQIHTVAAAVVLALPAAPPEMTAMATGLAAALLVLLIGAGGGKRVSAVMEAAIPVVAAAYIFGASAVIAAHGERVATVVSQIIRGAIAPEAVLGGGAGIGLRHAVHWGVSRGVFSNEAGLGSAPMAHASAEASPDVQGLYGIFEVFLDTVVLCTLTAVSILVSGVAIPYGTAAGGELAAAALETVFGGRAAGLLAVCLGLLALATMITWQYYGSVCAGYLWGSRGVFVYQIVHAAVILLGAVMELSAAWAVSELCNAIMCLPNLAALVLLTGQEPSCKTGRFLS